jgi:hypothetical protein
MKLLSKIRLAWKYGRLAKKLIGLYKAIESDYNQYQEQRGKAHAQAMKRKAWERRLERILQLYHTDRLPLTKLQTTEMRELTWDTMNSKKKDFIDYSIEDIKWEDVL